jgi:hypothetical protein
VRWLGQWLESGGAAGSDAMGSYMKWRSGGFGPRRAGTRQKAWPAPRGSHAPLHGLQLGEGAQAGGSAWTPSTERGRAMRHGQWLEPGGVAGSDVTGSCMKWR